MRPHEVLDMNLDQFYAFVTGYSDKLICDECNAVWAGYYSAYFMSKNPKKPGDIIKKIIHEHDKANKNTSHDTDIDINAEISKYEQLETRFVLAQLGGEQHGTTKYPV